MAEFLGAFAIAALGATLFLGGWRGPWLPGWLWVLTKTYALVFVMIWIRGTWPRFRIDQLLAFAWKCLLPVSVANVLAAGLWLVAPGPWGTLLAVGLTAGTFLITSQRWLPRNAPQKLQSVSPHGIVASIQRRSDECPM
ncbi:MAG: NADH-quinone oxidoreductase subunit H [Candidatus Omnitrophica bacterium]|nr:NADH-quinone oxidoreductase subunit H [Candidatus Omnitrophota bacterium]